MADEQGAANSTAAMIGDMGEFKHEGVARLASRWDQVAFTGMAAAAVVLGLSFVIHNRSWVEVTLGAVMLVGAPAVVARSWRLGVRLTPRDEVVVTNFWRTHSIPVPEVAAVGLRFRQMDEASVFYVRRQSGEHIESSTVRNPGNTRASRRKHHERFEAFARTVLGPTATLEERLPSAEERGRHERWSIARAGGLIVLAGLYSWLTGAVVVLLIGVAASIWGIATRKSHDRRIERWRSRR